MRAHAPATDRATDQQLKRFVTEGDVSEVIAVLVDPDGSTTTAVCGSAAHEDLGIDTLFPIHSVAKMFVGATAALMHHRGFLDLDAPITDLVAHERNALTVTLRQLVSNSSGLPADAVAPSRGTARVSNDLELCLKSLMRLSRLSTPAGTYAYSNFGFVAAACVIQTLAGRDFASLVREEIFHPLGMDSTTYDCDAARAQNQRARPRQGPGALSESCDPSIGEEWAAAGRCYSSARDLAAFATSFFSAGSVMGDVGRTWQADMLRPVVQIPIDSELAYGLGVMVGNRRGKICVGHEGTVGRTTTKLVISPDDGRALVWADSRGAEVRPLRNEIIDQLLGSTMGVGRINTRPGSQSACVRKAPAGPAADMACRMRGSFVRFGAAPLTVEPRGNDGDLHITDGQNHALFQYLSTSMWASSAATPFTTRAAPWLPHMDSSRLTVVADPEPSGLVRRLYLNGIPYCFSHQVRSPGTSDPHTQL